MPADFAVLLHKLGSQKFKTLWPAQGQVLQSYTASHWATKDLSVELPTGAGKTLIALLVAEARRAEGKKVAILSANKTLARQMLAEGEALGVPVVLMEGKKSDIPPAAKRAFQRATHVGIMNFWVYFNQSPVIDAADVLIMDDAHLAEHCLHSLFSVEITRVDHPALFASLVTELATTCPENPVLADAISDLSTAPAPGELLSFLDQQATSTRFREIVDASPYLKTDSDLHFRWQRVRNALNEANIYLSANTIWIRPYIYPLRNNEHYASTSQVLYLSATVGEDGDLMRRLGTRPITRLSVDPNHSNTTSGRRFVVMNRLEEGDLPPRVQHVLLEALMRSPKSLWLCSSRTEAAHFRDVVGNWLNENGLVGHPTWLLTPMGDEVDDFKSAATGHLFVAGRFDGMDFKDAECRLVVITKVPRAINLQEEFLTSHLRDAGFMRRRLNQRIVQALGRCNRSPEDFALYVLADDRFATHFGRESNRQGIPTNVIAEIDLAQDMAVEDEAKLISRVGEFLDGNFAEFDRGVAAALAAVPAPVPQQNVVDVAEDETAAWCAMFGSQNPTLAADHFEACWDALRGDSATEIGALHGYHWAKSLALAGAQGDKGAEAKSASVLNDAIGKGGKSSWFNRLRASMARRAGDDIEGSSQFGDAEYTDAIVRAFDDLIERLGPRGTRFDLWCNGVDGQLNSGDHAQFQTALVTLGELLGYGSSRPKYSAATDCRWRGIWGNTREVITFEAKVEHGNDKSINARDVGQAHNQLARASTEHLSAGFTVRGTLVTHLSTLNDGAQGSLGPIRIITQDAVTSLWKRVRELASVYRNGWSLDDIPARRSSASRILQRIPKAGWLPRALDASAVFVDSKLLLGEWR